MGRPAALWLLLIAAGCGAPSEPSDSEPSDSVPRATSTDALCAEHGVLEALCTQCNPALIPVFRARGDFCEEHNLPESICPVCHPERGGRPAEPLPLDEAPPDGLQVRLSSLALAERIGLRTEAVVAADPVHGVDATARIVYDASRLARVNARSPGVLRLIFVDVGSRVEAGDPLASIASAEVAGDRARLTSARSRLDIAETNLVRREALTGIASERQVLEARRERDEARAELSALDASLRVLGSGRGTSEYLLSAPLAGVVTERSASVGSYVSEDDVLLEIVDASRMWAEIEVPEGAASEVRPGMSVEVRPDSDPDRVIVGTLEYLAPSIDPHTRTVRGRVALDNPDGSLRANLFAHATVLAPREAAAFVVPRDALQRAEGVVLVFVRLEDDLYEARRVELVPTESARLGTDVEVTGRLDVGDQVVVDAAFLLRTETLRDSIGAGCCVADE